MVLYQARMLLLAVIGNRRLLASHYAKGGYYDRASKLYEELGDHAKAAECFLAMGNQSQAANSYLRAGELKSAANLYKALGRYDLASEYLFNAGEAAAAANLLYSLVCTWGADLPRSAPFQRAGDVYREAGAHDKALKLYRVAGAAAAAAACARTLGRNEEAAELFLKADDRQSAAACFEASGKYARAAEEYFYLKQFVKAADAYTQASDLFSAAAMQRAQGDLLKAAELYVACGEHSKAGHCYFEAGQHALASRAFGEAGDWQGLIDCSRKAGRPISRTAERAIEKYRSIAEELERLKHWSQAAERYQRIGDDAGYARVMRAQAELLRPSAFVDDRASPKRLAELERQGKFDQIAEVYRCRGDLEDAAGYYQKAGNNKALAGIHERLGQWMEAATAYERLGDRALAARARTLYELAQTLKADYAIEPLAATNAVCGKLIDALTRANDHAKHTRNYAEKAWLQSVLILLFPQDVVIEQDDPELALRVLGYPAKHMRLDQLLSEARHIVDPKVKTAKSGI